VTFLLDRDGTVKRVWTVEDIDAHAAEALEAARELVA
jgi:peroxiredoxin